MYVCIYIYFFFFFLKIKKCDKDDTGKLQKLLFCNISYRKKTQWLPSKHPMSQDIKAVQ